VLVTTRRRGSLAERSDAARSAAASVVEQLSLEERQEVEAQMLEGRATELRANSTALARQTLQRAMEAGSNAAHSKAKSLMETLVKLEDQARRAEVQAAALRAKRHADLLQADELMGVADTALKR